MNAAVRLVEVRVPDMGNFKDVAVIDVLVKPGETIEPEAPPDRDQESRTDLVKVYGF